MPVEVENIGIMLSKTGRPKVIHLIFDIGKRLVRLDNIYLIVIGRTRLVSFEAKNLNIASIDLLPPLVGSFKSKYT